MLSVWRFSFPLVPQNQPSTMANTIRLSFRALIYRDGDFWIVHCLETDVVAEGSSAVKAFENLQSLTALQIETALDEGDLSSIFRQAPPEIWAAFATGQEKPMRRKPPRYVDQFDVRQLQPA